MGILSTPSHKLGRTFKFKDYSPRVFRHIREHFGVDRVDYILSVAGNYTFLEFISNAKSGEFFFFSHDEKFMIKVREGGGGGDRSDSSGGKKGAEDNSSCCCSWLQQCQNLLPQFFNFNNYS